MNVSPECHGSVHVGHNTSLGQQKTTLRLVHTHHIGWKLIAWKPLRDLLTAEHFMRQVMLKGCLECPLKHPTFGSSGINGTGHVEQFFLDPLF